MAYPATTNNLNNAHTAGQVITSADMNAVTNDVDALTVKVGSGASTPTSGLVLTGGVVAGSSVWAAPTGGGGGGGTTGHPMHAVVTSAYTVQPSDADGIIPADATGGSFAVTLMAANSVIAGTEFTIKQLNTNANIVSVTPSGADTIDLVAGAYPLSPKRSITVSSNGVNGWLIK